MKAFTAKYGIKITDQEPEGTSQAEISAVRGERGARAPDVLDFSASYAVEAEGRHLLAPYQVRSWNAIPDTLKAASATWYADYGGYVAIGYDPARVRRAPRSFREPAEPGLPAPGRHHRQPRRADGHRGAGRGVGGRAGQRRLAERHQARPEVLPQAAPGRQPGPVAGSPATVASGRTPVLVWWDFLLAAQIRPAVPRLRIVIPPDARFENFYYQAVSRRAPHPAAAPMRTRAR